MNRKQLYNLIIIAVLILSSSPIFMVEYPNVRAAGNTYYVAKTGHDTTGTGSFANPWLTIQKGINSISGGDMLYVMDGDYNENISIYGNLNGTDSQWTTISSYTHWGATINGNGKTIEGYPGSEGLVFIQNVSYLRFTGFQLKNS
jgi:hypothetical protein